MLALVLAAILAVASAMPSGQYATRYAYDDQAVPTDYKFGLDVKDDYTYNQQSREESKYGDVVAGSYTVLQPDGLTRVVTYKDEGYGLIADVSYTGGYNSPAYAPAKPVQYSAPAYAHDYKPAAYRAPSHLSYRSPAYRAPTYNREYSPRY